MFIQVWGRCQGFLPTCTQRFKGSRDPHRFPGVFVAVHLTTQTRWPTLATTKPNRGGKSWPETSKSSMRTGISPRPTSSSRSTWKRPGWTGPRPSTRSTTGTVPSEGRWGPRRATPRRGWTPWTRAASPPRTSIRRAVSASAGSASRTCRWPFARPGTTSSPRSSRRSAPGSRGWRWCPFRTCPRRSRNCAGRSRSSISPG